jgi:hypothetical protein
MEPEAIPVATIHITCESCSNPHAADLNFCPACSYPVGGLEEEKSKFRMRIVRNKQLIKQAKEKIQTAKIIMYVLAALTLLTGIYQGFNNNDFTGLIINGILSIVYLAMAGWADNNPFGATLTVFILYITINLLNVFMSHALIFTGLIDIIVRISIVVGLIKGISSAKQAQDSLNELEKVKAATNRDR